MDTTVIPADSILSIEAVAEFFESRGVPFPEDLTEDSLREFKQDQSNRWALVLSDYQSYRTDWSKARSNLEVAQRAKSPAKGLIRDLELAEDLLHDQLKRFELSLLDARAKETVARALPQAFADTFSARFVARELHRAELYSQPL